MHTSYGHPYVLINEPAIAAVGDALPNSEIFRRLAAAMGFDEPCFRDSDEAIGAEAFGQVVNLSSRPAEDQRRCRVFHVEHAAQYFKLLAARNDVRRLAHLRRRSLGDRLGGDLQPDREDCRRGS